MDVADIISIILAAMGFGAAGNVLYAVSDFRRHQKARKANAGTSEGEVEVESGETTGEDVGHDVVMRVTSEGKTFDVYSASVALKLLEEISRTKGRIELTEPVEGEDRPDHVG